MKHKYPLKSEVVKYQCACVVEFIGDILIHICIY